MGNRPKETSSRIEGGHQPRAPTGEAGQAGRLLGVGYPASERLGQVTFRRMKLYLDTNVYSAIAKAGEVEEVRSLLSRRGAEVVASVTTLAEVWRIRDDDARANEMKAVTAVASRLLASDSYLHAQELLQAIRRHEPQWLRVHPDTSRIQPLLAFWLRSLGKLRRDPRWVPRGQQQFEQDSEAGLQLFRQDQKAKRTFQLIKTELRKYVTILGVDVPIEDLNTFWRLHSMAVWRRAIVDRIPESRDYADWLGPYLRAGAWRDAPSLLRFWLAEVDENEVPRNRITALTEYFQTRHKITHGNANDALHAVYLVDCDVFLTADRRFQETLGHVLGEIDTATRVLLINQAQGSLTQQLAAAI